MKLLLDTHIWLWMLVSPERLGSLGPVIEDTRNELVLSAASSWEIAIKFSLGRLSLPEAPATYVPDRIQSTGVSPIAVEHKHALKVSELPMHHRDPFDRLLIAQASTLGIALASADEQFAKYDISVLNP
ncbi:MAG: type II toxin-antitoxin system VapC family toxin [Trueperaceae bacterium]